MASPSCASPPPLTGGSTTPPPMVASGSAPLHAASFPLSGRHRILQPHLQEQQGIRGISDGDRDGRRQHQRKRRPQDRRERDPLQEKQAQEGGFILGEEADANTGKDTRRKEDHAANVKRGRQQQKSGRHPQDQQKQAPLQKEQAVSSSFAAATPVPTFTIPTDVPFEILQYWKTSSATYPTLSRIALDMLAVPASTVASESAFSNGEKTISQYRSRLTSETVEALVCLQDWIRGKDVSTHEDIAGFLIGDEEDDDL